MLPVQREIRQMILQQSKRAGVGHIGSALSVADLLVALYTRVLNIPSPDDPERDRFVLSKGHSALALYSTFRLKGWLTQEQLDTFCGDGTLLGVHPEHALRGVDFSTGSLGHGLTIGTGAALAARFQGSPRRAFVLLSDAECNEGSTWEAAMFAAHHRLGNLIALLDLNGQQAFGYTREVLDLAPMAARWRDFGWDVHEVDGHNVDEIAETIEGLQGDKPHMLVAHTVFGKGVSYMESQIKWHYWTMSDDEYRQAQQEVEAAV